MLGVGRLGLASGTPIRYRAGGFETHWVIDLLPDLGRAAIQQGYRVLYREADILLNNLADAVAEGTRKEFMETLTTVPLLIVDDFGVRKLPLTAARGPVGDHPAALRARQHAARVEPRRRRLGKDVAAVTDAGSLSSPRPRPQVRPAKLAHKDRCRDNRDTPVTA